MQSLEKLLKKGADQGLGKIVQRAQHMDQLSRCVEAALCADLASQVLAANLREDGELVVVCRSSAGAARLRFEEEAILKAARDSGAEARSFRVRVGR